MADKETKILNPRENNKTNRERREKEEKQIKWLKTGGMAAIALIAVAVIAGIIYGIANKPSRKIVASVGEEKITLEEFQEAVRLQRSNINSNYSYMQQLYAMFGMEVDETTRQSYAYQMSDAYKGILGQSVLSNMIDERVLAYGAAQEGVTVSDDEIETYYQSMFGYYPNGTPTSAPTTEPLEATPTVTDEQLAILRYTDTPMPTEEAAADEAEGAEEGEAEAEEPAEEPAESAEAEAAETVEEAASEVEETVDQAEETVEETVDDAAAAVEETVDQVEETVDDAAAAVEETVDQVEETAEETVDDAAAAVEETVDQVEEAVEETVDDAAAAVEETVDQVEEAVEEAASDAEETVDGAVDAVEEAEEPAEEEQEAEPTAEPTPAPTATVMSEEVFRQYEAYYFANNYQISKEFMKKNIGYDILRAKIKARIEAETPRSADMVWARHILVATEEEALAALERINSGEEWGDVAAELSQDSTASTGGDLGWFTEGTMVQAFNDAAFSQEVGTISDPVQTDFGWHLIQIIAHEEHPFTDDQFDDAVDAAYTEWLDGYAEQLEISFESDVSNLTPTDPAFIG